MRSSTIVGILVGGVVLGSLVSAHRAEASDPSGIRPGDVAGVWAVRRVTISNSCSPELPVGSIMNTIWTVDATSTGALTASAAGNTSFPDLHPHLAGQQFQLSAHMGMAEVERRLEPLIRRNREVARLVRTHGQDLLSFLALAQTMNVTMQKTGTTTMQGMEVVTTSQRTPDRQWETCSVVREVSARRIH